MQSASIAARHTTDTVNIVTGSPSASAAEQQAATLYRQVQACSDDEKFKLLKTLWNLRGDGNPPPEIAALAQRAQGRTGSGNAPDPATAEAKATRIELTRLILAGCDPMSRMSTQFDELLNTRLYENGDESQLAQLVSIHVRAYEKTAGARTNLCFAFLHLVSLTLKTRIVDNISASLTELSTAADKAATATAGAARTQDAALQKLPAKAGKLHTALENPC